jgi:hypothetical protein
MEGSGDYLLHIQPEDSTDGTKTLGKIFVHGVGK